MQYEPPNQHEPPDQHDSSDRRPSLARRVFGRPSSRLGWTATAALVGSIALVILVNVLSEQGGGEDSRGGVGGVLGGVVFVAMVLCLLVSWVTGLIAVFRRRERSWAVLLPTALLSLVVLNELIQGLLQLVGLGGE